MSYKQVRIDLGKMRTKINYDKSHLRRFIKDQTANQVKAINEAKHIIRLVIQVTVGKRYYSLATLKAMGHPYSRRFSSPPMHPGVINRQSGEFADSFKIIGPIPVGNSLLLTVSSDSEKKELLDKGTSRMMARPYKRLLQGRIRREIRRVVGVAFGRQLVVRVD